MIFRVVDLLLLFLETIKWSCPLPPTVDLAILHLWAESWRQKTHEPTVRKLLNQRFGSITADGKMKKAHKCNWKSVHLAEDDSEDWAARDGRWYRDKGGECESSAGRNPESHSSRREWYLLPEEDCVPTYSQVLQGRSHKTKTFMTCPPIIVCDNNQHRFPWEDKPTVVMKITKRKRCKRNKDAPKAVSAPSLTSTEKRLPADSRLTSNTSLIQGGRRPEDRGTKTWTSGVNVREEDTPETAETKQTTVQEEEPNSIWETKVQQLEAEQNDRDGKDHEDSETYDQLGDKEQEMMVKRSISEMGGRKRELQEAECRQRLHQLDEGRNTVKVKNTNSEFRVQQQTEDKQQLSHSHDASHEKVQQLVATKITIHEMLVILLEDKKTEGTKDQQSFVTKHEDLLQQIESITDKEEKMEMQLQQLQQREGPLEEVFGGLKKKRKKRFPSIFFTKASKIDKETTAETEMTAGEVKKKRRKWFPLIFSSKASKMVKEAMAETEMTEGEVLVSGC